MNKRRRVRREDHEEIERYVGYACDRSRPEYRPRFQAMYGCWSEDARAWGYDDVPWPHIEIGITPPNALSTFRLATGNGAPYQIVLNEKLVLGTNARWVREAWDPAEGTGAGTGRLIEDELRRRFVQLALHFREGVFEEGHRGFGPRFTEEINRITHDAWDMLIPLVTAHDHPEKAKYPLACYWPHVLRNREYYQGHVTEELFQRVGGGRKRATGRHRQRYVGLWMWILCRLEGENGVEALRQIAVDEYDARHRLRPERQRTNLRIEKGELDIDGKTPLGEVRFDPEWLRAHNFLVAHLTHNVWEYRAFGLLPALADALEKAGCTDARILGHLRDRSLEHTSGCWVITGLLEADPRDKA